MGSTRKSLIWDWALPFLPTAGNVGEELRRSAQTAAENKAKYGANYVDGYDTSRWFDVERIKNLTSEDLFDPLYGKQALWDAKRRWDKAQIDPAATLREYGYIILRLASVPLLDPHLS